MTPQLSLINHDPEKNQFGDCFRACIATLLDIPIDDVPNFAEPWDKFFLNRCRAFLKPLGYGYYEHALLGEYTIKQCLKYMADQNANMYYIFVGGTETGTNHAVVCLNDAVVHDPTPEIRKITGRDSIIGPCKGAEKEADAYFVGLIVAGCTLKDDNDQGVAIQECMEYLKKLPREFGPIVKGVKFTTVYACYSDKKHIEVVISISGKPDITDDCINQVIHEYVTDIPAKTREHFVVLWDHTSLFL